MVSERTRLAIHTTKTESVDGAPRSSNVEGLHSSVEHRATFESETNIGVIEGCLVELHSLIVILGRPAVGEGCSDVQLWWAAYAERAV